MAPNSFPTFTELFLQVPRTNTIITNITDFKALVVLCKYVSRFYATQFWFTLTFLPSMRPRGGVHRSML